MQRRPRRHIDPQGLSELSHADLPAATAALADAFHDDPLWGAVFADDHDRPATYRTFVETPLRYSLRYGGVHASSEELEGVVAWVPGERADMSLWGLLASGAFGSMMRIGSRAGKALQHVFGPWSRARGRHMRGRRFVYLSVVGVRREEQGRGIGGRLMRSIGDASDRVGLPVYLETETEDNVRFYERLGFGVLESITLPVVDLPAWLMLREPRPAR
jgi:ribosomal protein S18 acetylase RimI-like enzyme